MTRISLIRASFAALTTQLFASAALAEPSAILTSPPDGSWYDISGRFDVAGLAAAPGTVEVQYLDSRTHEWAHLEDFETSSEPADNAQGNLQYSFGAQRSILHQSRNYYCQGPTRDDGQRSNAIYLSVWGWGDTPMREPGHYTSIYQVCGRDGQSCCNEQAAACDDGLECGAFCNGDGRCDKTIPVCKPKVEKEPEDPPPQQPQQPQQPQLPECGEPGLACCAVGPECSQQYSYCSSGMCMTPGDWWTLTCVCDTGFGVGQMNILACYAPELDSALALDVDCNVAGQNRGYSCIYSGVQQMNPSLGHCLAQLGNVIQ